MRKKGQFRFITGLLLLLQWRKKPWEIRAREKKEKRQFATSVNPYCFFFPSLYPAPPAVPRLQNGGRKGEGGGQIGATQITTSERGMTFLKGEIRNRAKEKLPLPLK